MALFSRSRSLVWPVAAGLVVLGTYAEESVVTGVALGPGAAANAPGAVAIGANARVVPAKGLNAVAIGQDAEATGYPTVAGGSGYETVAVGENSLAKGWRCTALGAKAKAGVVSATAVGRGAYAWGAHMIAIGRGAYMEKVPEHPDLRRQNACGIAGDSLWLGGMMCHRTIDRTGDSEVVPDANGGDRKRRWPVRTFRPRNYTIHGMDACDARFAQDPELYDQARFDPDDKSTWIHRVDNDVGGGDLTLAPGRGTGTADGGSLVVTTAPAGGKTGNRKNPAQTALKIDTNTAAGETRLMLLDLDTGKLSRVVVHELELSGKTYRLLGFPGLE